MADTVTEEAYPSVMETQTRNLTAQDRCDSCSAAALSWAEKGDAYLQFCDHHMKKQRTALEEKGWTVFDPRVLDEALIEEPAPTV